MYTSRLVYIFADLVVLGRRAKQAAKQALAAGGLGRRHRGSHYQLRGRRERLVAGVQLLEPGTERGDVSEDKTHAKKCIEEIY